MRIVTRNKNFFTVEFKDLSPPESVQLGYSPAFRSAIGRSEREGMLSSTTSLEINQLDPQEADRRAV